VESWTWHVRLEVPGCSDTRLRVVDLTQSKSAILDLPLECIVIVSGDVALCPKRGISAESLGRPASAFTLFHPNLRLVRKGLTAAVLQAHRHMDRLCDPVVDARTRFPLQRAADHIRSIVAWPAVHLAQPAWALCSGH
jgi:hypothetical protein